MAEMIPTRLLTRQGEYVTTIDVPRFTPKAEVIQWGIRIFVLTPSDEYREGIAWTAPPGHADDDRG